MPLPFLSSQHSPLPYTYTGISMSKQSCRILPFALLLAGGCAHAAPLDALLSATKPSTPGQAIVEISYDMTNSSLDFLNLRNKNNVTSNVGDYKGGHIGGGVAITPELWIDGTYWKRKIDYRSFDADLTSWQVAGQYKFNEAEGAMPALALRVGAWSNNADSLTKFTNTTVSSIKFTSATVHKPADQQVQLDLIGTWPVSQNTEISAFASAGASRVKFDTISATSRTKNGCEYNIAFDTVGAIGELAQPCSASVVITRFVIPASDTVDVYKEARYRSSYAQAGFMADWHSVNWRLRGGYQFQYIKRNNVDDIIISRGGSAYKHNHVAVADVSYNAHKNIVVFLRGQFMTNQFNGELPLAYNSLTADKYNQRYGVVSTGLMLVF